MKNTTAIGQVRDVVNKRVPSAGTTEALLRLQSELSKILKDIDDLREEEKDQLREAFNRGVVHGMLSSANRNEEVLYGFEQYYKDRYEDDKA